MFKVKKNTIIIKKKFFCNIYSYIPIRILTGEAWDLIQAKMMDEQVCRLVNTICTFI